MKAITTATLFLVLGASVAVAQDPSVMRQLPEGAIAPANLNELGSQMRDRVGEIVRGDLDEIAIPGASEDDGLSLFSGRRDEDPNILKIKEIARDLDTRRGMMLKIAALQEDLIEFARADPAAAYMSRIPSSVCEYAIEDRFCNAMAASFRDRTIVVRQE